MYIPPAPHSNRDPLAPEHISLLCTKNLNMMPCIQHIERSSPSCPECGPRKNGFHNADKTINGKQLRKELSEQVTSSDSRSKQDFSMLCRDGDELIKILEKDPKNLEAVSNMVQNYKNMVIPCKNSNSYLRVCDLSNTDYMGQEYMKQAWEEIYLHKITKMEVLGILEDRQDILTSVPWIILVGDDGHIYAYGDEELKFIAENLREFQENGRRNNCDTYYFPELSDEEDQAPQQDEEIQKIRQRGREYVNKNAKKFDDFLSLFSS